MGEGLKGDERLSVVVNYVWGKNRLEERGEKLMG